MGNEALHSHNPDNYPKPNQSNEKFVSIKKHTVDSVLDCLDSLNILPSQTELDIGNLNAGDIFCGYLMLDTLISNQERHHENWAIVVDNSKSRYLCPTYDHAASLGRELTDENRKQRMNTRDKNQRISTFVRKSKSELFKRSTDKKRLLTIDAFYLAVKKREVAKKHWLSRLNDLTDKQINQIFINIPDNLITLNAKQFAIQMLLENKKRLLKDERA